MSADVLPSSDSLKRKSPSRRDRKSAAILAGSVALHGVVLGLIGLGIFDSDLALPQPPSDAPIFIEMEPRPLLDGETARVPTTAPARATDAPALTSPLSPSIAPRKLDEQDDAPTAPAPRAAAGGAAGGAAAPAGAANPWSYQPESRGAAVARTMRTGAGGCRIMDGHLSAAEQALCDERFNEGAAAAAARHPLGNRTLTPSEQRRQAEFAAEGRRALERYEARRAPLRGGTGNVTTGDCPGSNFGTGCAGANLEPSMREGATSTIRQDSNLLPSDQHKPVPGHEPQN
ncbi:MAG TPA: hypothetical protein VF633_13115 [Brevundimonas sp.]